MRRRVDKVRPVEVAVPIRPVLDDAVGTLLEPQPGADDVESVAQCHGQRDGFVAQPMLVGRERDREGREYGTNHRRRSNRTRATVSSSRGEPRVISL